MTKKYGIFMNYTFYLCLVIKVRKKMFMFTKV